MFVCVLLQGRTAQRFRTVITLGVLSFNKYQPTDQKVGHEAVIVVTTKRLFVPVDTCWQTQGMQVCPASSLVCCKTLASAATSTHPTQHAGAAATPVLKCAPHDRASQIRMQDDDSHPGGVYKGPHGDTQQAYIVSAPFELVEAEKVGEAAGDAKPIGINGNHLIMGEYKQDPDNPQRLIVTFKSKWCEW